MNFSRSIKSENSDEEKSVRSELDYSFESKNSKRLTYQERKRLDAEKRANQKISTKAVNKFELQMDPLENVQALKGNLDPNVLERDLQIADKTLSKSSQKGNKLEKIAAELEDEIFNSDKLDYGTYDFGIKTIATKDSYPSNKVNQTKPKKGLEEMIGQELEDQGTYIQDHMDIEEQKPNTSVNKKNEVSRKRPDLESQIRNELEDYGTMVDLDQYDQKKPKEDKKKMAGLEGMIQDEISHNQTISPTRDSYNIKSNATLSTIQNDAQKNFPFARPFQNEKSGIDLQLERERLHLEEMQKSEVYENTRKNFKDLNIVPTNKKPTVVGLEAQIAAELEGGMNVYGQEKFYNKNQKFGLEAQIENELAGVKRPNNFKDPYQISNIGLEAQVAREFEQEINPYKKHSNMGKVANVEKYLAANNPSQSDDSVSDMGYDGLEAQIKRELKNENFMATKDDKIKTRMETKIAHDLLMQESKNVKKGRADNMVNDQNYDNFYGIEAQIAREFNNGYHDDMQNPMNAGNQDLEDDSPIKGQFEGLEEKIKREYRLENNSNPDDNGFTGLEAQINGDILNDNASIRSGKTWKSFKSERAIKMKMFFENGKSVIEITPIRKKLLIVLSVIVSFTLIWLLNYKRVNGRDIPEGFSGLPIGGEHLHIFLVPYSNNPVGLDLTPEQYFNGTHGYHNTPGGSIKKSYDSVIKAMSDDNRRKFSISEVYYFKLWWNMQKQDIKNLVKDLVREGRLEILGTGASENDSATSYFEDMIDNKFNSVQFAREEMDGIPKTAWQISSAGLSSSEAMINSRLGYSSMVVSKVHFQDKFDMLMNNGLKTLWRPNNQKKDQIMTEVTPGNYCAPAFLNEKGVMNLRDRINKYNVEKYADRFFAYATENKKSIKSNYMLQLLGCDYSWYQADHDYQNIERMVRYFNSNPERYPEASIYFVTPSEYFNYLSKSKTTFPVKIDDYYPYADNDLSYWVGYYTSKPIEKHVVKELGRLNQKLKSFASRLYVGQKEIVKSETKDMKPDQQLIDNDFAGDKYNNSGTKSYPKINHFQKKNNHMIIYNEYLRKAIEKMGNEVSIAQSVNAIGGTSKTDVQKDYFARMENVKTIALKAMQKYFKYDLKTNLLPDLKDDIYFTECQINNPYSVDCPTYEISNGKSSLVSVYNPGPKREIIVRIPVKDDMIEVIDDETNARIKYDLFEYTGDNSRFKFMVVFMKPIDFKSYKYFMVRKSSSRHAKVIRESANFQGNMYDFWWKLMNPETYYTFQQETPVHDDKVNPTRKMEVMLTTKDYCNPADPKFQECETKRDKTKDFKDTILIKVFKTFREYELDYSVWINLEKYTTMAKVKQHSGSFIFQTDKHVDDKLESVTDFDSITNLEGTYFNEIIIRGKKAKVVIRVPRTEDFFFKPDINVPNKNKNEFAFEVETTLFPDTLKKHTNEEVVLKVKHSGIDNRATFYTDANGLFMQKRVLDYFYASEQPKKVEKNYYPVNSAIFIEDWFESPGEEEAGLRMTVMNDRSQGGSSLRKGEVEIMINRKTWFDDNRGSYEPLRNNIDSNGNAHKEGVELTQTHRVIIDKKSSKQNLQRRIQYFDDLKPITLVGNYDGSKFSKQVTEIDYKIKPDSANDVYRNVGNRVGGYGGYCLCPSGKSYPVGDNKNGCKSLACTNGKPGKCYNRDGEWSGHSVTCSTEIPKITEDSSKKGLENVPGYDLNLASNFFTNSLVKIVETPIKEDDFMVRVTNISDNQEGFVFSNTQLKDYLFEGLFPGLDTDSLNKQKDMWYLKLTSMNYYEKLEEFQEKKIDWNKVDLYQDRTDHNSEAYKLCKSRDCKLDEIKKYHMNKFDILTFAFYKKE